MSPPAATIFSSAASDACGRILRRSSAGVTVAVPFLPTATAAAALATRSAALPIGAGRKRQRQHRGDGVAGAGDVAHLDRQAGTWIGFAAARHQRHAVLALRHQHGLAIGEMHGILRGLGDVLLGIGAAAGRFGEFLAVGREQRRAAIDREIGALGIDDHGLAELPARRR